KDGRRSRSPYDGRGPRGAGRSPPSDGGCGLSALIHTLLERDLVGVEARLVAVRCLRRLRWLRFLSRTAHAGLAIAPRVEHAKVVGDDLHRQTLLALAVGPRSRLKTALDEHQATLLDQLLCRLREALPADDAEPLGLLASLAGGAVVEDAVDRD